MRQEVRAGMAQQQAAAGLQADVYETPGGEVYVLEIAVPGLEPSEIVLEADVSTLAAVTAGLEQEDLMTTQHMIQHLARSRVAVVLAGLAIGLPQVRGGQPTVAWHPSGQDSTITWRATLAPPQPPSPDSTAIGGTATVTSAGKQKTRADVHVANAKPGSVHPWHIHKGKCGEDKGIVGPAKAYTPLHIGADGEGEVTVTLPFATPTSGEYMVNVHKSTSDLKTIVACGDLKRE